MGTRRQGARGRRTVYGWNHGRRADRIHLDCRHRRRCARARRRGADGEGTLQEPLIRAGGPAPPIGTPSRSAPIAQLAEAGDLKSPECGFESHWGHFPSGRGSHLAELRRRIDELPENLAAPHACASCPRSAASYSRICDGVEPFVSAWCFRSADRTALRMTAHVISRLTAATISPMRRE